MASTTAIEWTEATWNPVTGCDRVSPGCARCYALRIAERFRGTVNFPDGFAVTLRPERLQLPLRWRRPRKIFVNSMSDLFHESVPIEFIREVFDTMRLASWHQFQVLTKRSKRLRELAPSLDWPNNVWMGVSVENQRWTERIDDLRTVPAAVRFLSIEPLVGSVVLNLDGIDWVIVGGESGPGARPMRLDWALSVRDQCLTARVPFFFKQWGNHDAHGKRTTKKVAGRTLQGETWDQLPRIGAR